MCFCTLAIHAPYRERARRLCADAPGMPWVVLTDEVEAFADLPVRAVPHAPTGPMASDYREFARSTGHHGGAAAAYHDKRFALQEALRDYESAMFFDADTRLKLLPRLPDLPPQLAVLPVIRESIAVHLASCGTWRWPAFVALARELTGSDDILYTAQWCLESCYAVTPDRRERVFFEVWDRAADWLQTREVFSGEGGVMGLAAALAGWNVDHGALASMMPSICHEGCGIKDV